jgi:hypothetical protein
MKQTSLLIWFLVSFFSLRAEDYFFLALEDSYYENPANWFPAYPGDQISDSNRVVLMADASFGSYDIHIAGSMEITLGVRLHSALGSLQVMPSGTLDNQGSLMVMRIKNYGTLYNRLSALIYLYEYIAYDGAITQNACSAVFETIAHIENSGRFDNYSRCIAGSDFSNSCIFNQIYASRLEVSGRTLLSTGCLMYRQAGRRRR